MHSILYDPSCDIDAITKELIALRKRLFLNHDWTRGESSAKHEHPVKYQAVNIYDIQKLDKSFEALLTSPATCSLGDYAYS
jgi:hypothetical protein